MKGNKKWRKEEEKRLGSIWKGMKPGEPGGKKRKRGQEVYERK